MPKKPLTIIGINPGTRYLGICVLSGSELRDWRIKALKGKWSKEKMEKIKGIVSGLIKCYEPDALAIKKLNPNRSSLNLNMLVAGTLELAKRKGLKVLRYSIKDIEAFFSDERINKKKLAEIIASQHPVLFNELNKEKTQRNPYYIRMFEAVALASVCLHQLDKHY